MDKTLLNFRLEDELEKEEKISSQKVEKLAFEMLQKEMGWLHVHVSHGKIIMKHLSEWDEEVKLTEENWISLHDTSRKIQWKYYFLCPCGETLIIVDENTPDELAVL